MAPRSGRGRVFAHCEALAEQSRKGGTGAPLRGNKRISTRSTNERVHTLGGAVVARVHEGARTVTVDMGEVRFDSFSIPVIGPSREVINEELSVGGTAFTYCAATIGNPHCVLPVERVDAALALHRPHIEGPLDVSNRESRQFPSTH